jgi:hypothetical protein
MDPDFADLPEMPKDFDGKLKMLRQQVGEFMRVAREIMNGPLSGNESPEMHMLGKAMEDLEEVAPAAMDAFAEANQLHMQIAEESLKAAEEFPAKIKALDEQLAKELAPFLAENFIPRPEEPIPPFLDILDLERDLSELQALLLEGTLETQVVSKAPTTTGNIWENWNRGTDAQAKPGKKNGPQGPVEYLFTVKLIQKLGLEVEPEKQLPTGGNIWENWK